MVAFAFGGVENIYQTPVYPTFLAAIFAVFGNHWWSIAFVQGALDALSAVAISRIGAKLSANGWWAGLVYALFPYAAMQSRAIVDTPLIVAFFALAIFVDVIRRHVLCAPRVDVRQCPLCALASE